VVFYCVIVDEYTKYNYQSIAENRKNGEKVLLSLILGNLKESSLYQSVNRKNNRNGKKPTRKKLKREKGKNVLSIFGNNAGRNERYIFKENKANRNKLKKKSLKRKVKSFVIYKLAFRFFNMENLNNLRMINRIKDGNLLIITTLTTCLKQISSKLTQIPHNLNCEKIFISVQSIRPECHT
jgi:hypothetical protein